MLTLVMVTWLTATVLLMAVPEQALQRYQINALWLNRYYGYHSEPMIMAFRAGDTRYTHVQGVLYREQVPVVETSQKLLGAVVIGDQHVVATETRLWIFSEEGKLIKQLKPLRDNQTVIMQTGIHYGLPILQTSVGMWRGNPETWHWTPVELFGVSWSEAITVSADQLLSSAPRLTLHQLLIDIVRGRIIKPG